MGTIALPRRNSLSSRVHAFGGLNGRGYRFGAERAEIETAIASNAPNSMYYNIMLNHTDWAALYASDPVFARDAYFIVNNKALDPEYSPNIDIWFMRKNGQLGPQTPSPAPYGTKSYTPPSNVDVVTPMPIAPITISQSVNTPAPSTPGQTDSDYARQVAENQVQAAALAAQATANAARLRQEAQAAKDAEASANTQLATQDTIKTESSAVSEKPKSNAMPLLIAAGLAFLVLKG